MAQIIVDIDRLNSYSKSLSEKKDEFANIKNNMLDIIASLNKCWVGEDSSSFRKTATEYLENLKSVEESLSNQSGEMKSQQNQYQERIARAMSFLG